MCVSDIHDGFVSPTSSQVSSLLHWYQQIHLLPVKHYCIDCTYSNLSITRTYHICFTPQSVTQTMCLICELLTEEPEGGCDMILFETFKELYTYRAQWTAVQWGPRYKWSFCSGLNSYSMKLITKDGCGNTWNKERDIMRLENTI